MEKFYTGINNYMHRHKLFAGAVNITDKLITASMALFYPGFLIWLYANSIDYFVLIKCIVIPAVGFLIVSLWRKFNHSKRPYEVYDITPINGKATVEHSFPSRHVFSIFMIAETYLYVMDSPSAAIFYILGLVLSFCRVMMGVHFIKDVLMGNFFALICGVFFY